MEVGGEMDEVSQLCVGAGGDTKAVVDVTEVEVGDGALVRREQGLFDVPDKEAHVAGAHACAHSYALCLEEMGGIEREVIEGKDQLR